MTSKLITVTSENYSDDDENEKKLSGVKKRTTITESQYAREQYYNMTSIVELKGANKMAMRPSFQHSNVNSGDSFQPIEEAISLISDDSDFDKRSGVNELDYALKQDLPLGTATKLSMLNKDQERVLSSISREDIRLVYTF